MTPDDIARMIAYDLDGEYHDGLEADISAYAEDASLVIKVTPDDGTVRRFRAVLVELTEEPSRTEPTRED